LLHCPAAADYYVVPLLENRMRTKTSLTLADAKKILATCEAKAAESKWAVAISVVDEGGFLIGFARMDGAPAISAEVSMGKARTSALTGRPSKFFEDMVKQRPAFISFPAGYLIQGGVPVIHGNECIGAIGVSGVQSHQDEEVAQAGAGALA
jgi:glc operon protein GlcG